MRLKAVIAGVVMLMSGAAWSDSAGQRVVSADGSLTETLYALGAGDLLVAVDTTSNLSARYRRSAPGRLPAGPAF